MKQVGVQYRLGIGGRRLEPESDLQNLQRKIDIDRSISDGTSETVGAWIPELADEWIAKHLPNHPSLKTDSQ